MIFGVFIIGLNTLLLRLTMKRLVGKARGFSVATFLVSFVLRYAILGVLAWLFLTRGWGSPIGLLAGITAGLLAFMVARRCVGCG